MTRTIRELLSDRLLLLWLIYDAMNRRRFGETKIQKLTFLSEWDMLDNREKGFNYNFIKFTFGPFSAEVEKDVAWFEENGLVEATPIDEKARIFRETRLGGKILNDFHEMFVRNSIFTQKIAKVNRRFASMPLPELLNYVYSLPHPYRKGQIVAELKLKTPLLYKLDETKAKVKFEITPEELATLDIYLDDANYRSLLQASENAKRKPFLNFDEVF